MDFEMGKTRSLSSSKNPLQAPETSSLCDSAPSLQGVEVARIATSWWWKTHAGQAEFVVSCSKPSRNASTHALRMCPSMPL